MQAHGIYAFLKTCLRLDHGMSVLLQQAISADSDHMAPLPVVGQHTESRIASESESFKAHATAGKPEGQKRRAWARGASETMNKDTPGYIWNKG